MCEGVTGILRTRENSTSADLTILIIQAELDIISFSPARSKQPMKDKEIIKFMLKNYIESA